MLSYLGEGLVALLTFENVIFMVLGTALGILVGAVPGLNGTMTVALLVPVTFVLDPLTGLAMLGGIYNGAIYGGAISAILFRVPGTPASVATTLDGYPMTQKGQGSVALEAAVSSSFVGGVVSDVALLMVAPALARVALAFGPAEYFWVAIFGLTLIISLSTESFAKGMISGLFGLFLATVGLDPLTAHARFTFGQIGLYGGVELISVLIGMFALPQAFAMGSRVRRTDEPGESAHPARVIMPRPFGLFRRLWKTYARSSLIGTVVGIIPGAGGEIASILGYSEAKRTSKEPHKFGTGTPEGVVASEAANNGITGGSLVPLLTLGIPGSTTTAAMAGAFLVHGLDLGPLLFERQPVLVTGLILSLIVGNVLMLFMGYYGSRYFARLTEVPPRILAPLIVIFSVLGSYSMRGSIFDVGMMFGFGLLGYVMERYGYPVAPAVLGLILGPLAESNLVRTLTISGGSVAGLFNSWLSWLLVALSLLSVISASMLRSRASTGRLGLGSAGEGQ